MRGEACLLNQLELLVEDAELFIEALGGLAGPHKAAVEDGHRPPFGAKRVVLVPSCSQS